MRELFADEPVDELDKELRLTVEEAAKLLRIRRVKHILKIGEERLVAVVEAGKTEALLKAGKGVYALQVKNEAHVLRGLRGHPHTPKLYGYIGLGDVNVLLEEYLPYRSLEAVRGWPWSRLAGFIFYSLGGLMHIHTRGVVHSDIKPSNLIAHPRRGIVFIDFGVSVHLCSRGIGGTTGYTCPEAWQDTPITTGCDLYSIAAVIYYLVSGKRPPKEPVTLARMLSVLPLPRAVSETLVSLVLNPEKRSRLAAPELMKVVASSSPVLSMPHVVVNGVRYSLAVSRSLKKDAFTFKHDDGLRVEVGEDAILYRMLGGSEEVKAGDEAEISFGDVLVSKSGNVAIVYAGKPPEWEPPSCG